MGTTSRLVATALATLVAAGCTDDVLDASYASRSEVEADGAIARGWVPKWLPVEATHIREVDNIDSSESALAFRLPAGAGWRPPSPCQPATGSKPEVLASTASGYLNSMTVQRITVAQVKRARAQQT